ncbi:MAG: hypothetical protein ACM33U_13695 [Solirubrobacterales bacterium]
MAVTDEQRAMLQLLLEGGQSYEDIGSLLGVAPDEVRSRARSALDEIGGADPDAQVGLSDYLLGQADPIGRADAVRHLQSDPEANALAQRLVQNLRLLAPKAQLPEIPEPRGGRRAAPPPSPAAAPTAAAPAPQAPSPAAAPKGPGFASRAAAFFSGLGSTTGHRRTQLVVGLAAGITVVIVIIVVATSGGGGGSSDCKPIDTSAAQQAGVPTIGLSATGEAANADCPPTGQVTLIPVPQQGKNGQTQAAGFALQTNAVHLEPSANGDEYVLWLTGSGDQARPLGQETVASDGNLKGAAPLPTQELILLQALPTIKLSRVTQAEFQRIQQALAAQSKAKRVTGLVPFAGTTVLEGSATQLLQQLQRAVSAVQGQAGGTGSSGAQPQAGGGGTKR